MKVVLLLVTHGIAFGAGWWMLRPAKGKPPGQSVATASTVLLGSQPQRASSTPSEAPGQGDHRARWKELLAESGRDAQEQQRSFLLDWCKTDPRGALEAMRKWYAPELADDTLRQMSSDNGDRDPEAFFEIVPTLTNLKESDRLFALRQVAKRAAKSDPDRAAALAFSMSPGTTRGQVMQDLFEGLDDASFAKLSKRFTGKDSPLASPAEKTLVWTALAKQVDARGRLEGMVEWLPLLRDKEAFNAFAYQLSNTATRFQKWPEVIGMATTLEPGPATELIDSMRDGFSQELWRAEKPGAFLDAVGANLTPQMTERLLAGGLFLALDRDHAGVFLDRIRSASGEAGADLEISCYAAWRADPAKAEETIKALPAGARRDVGAREAVRYFSRESPDTAREWLSEIRDPSARQAAEAFLH